MILTIPRLWRSSKPTPAGLFGAIRRSSSTNGSGTRRRGISSGGRWTEGAGPGTFLLAGSASPQTAAHPFRRWAHRDSADEADEPVRARRSVSLGEPGRSCSQAAAPDIGGETDVTLDHYAREIAASGFPGMRSADSAVRPTCSTATWTGPPTTTWCLMGHRVRRPGLVRRWLSAYAAATSTAASYETIRDAATGGESAKPAKTTTTLYRKPARGDVAGRPAGGVVAPGQPLEPAQTRPEAPSGRPRPGSPTDRRDRLGTGERQPGLAPGARRGAAARGRCSSRWSRWTCGSTPRSPEPP